MVGASFSFGHRITKVSVQSLLDVYVVLFGLVIGSYLNVVVYRLPRRISTVFPRSRCPRCRAAIPPWDNVPVLSYLLLRGRCRRCGVQISWRYPMIEVITGICFFLSYRHFGATTGGVIAACFCSAMIVLALIDLEHYILPDVITKPGIVIGLALQPWIPWSSFSEGLIGAILGASILAAVSWGWYWWRGVHGIGFGDFKMLAMVGAFLGWKGTVLTLLLGSLTGSIVGVALMVSGRMGSKSKLPFGFFLALGAVVALFFGQKMIVAYLDLSGLRYLT